MDLLIKMKSTLTQIENLRKKAKERNDMFYYEALGQIKDFVVLDNYEDLYKMCEN